MPRILDGVLASTRPQATGTPELANTGNALKLDDTEDAVVGFRTQTLSPNELFHDGLPLP
jgi:hypothetical protein